MAHRAALVATDDVASVKDASTAPEPAPTMANCVLDTLNDEIIIPITDFVAFWLKNNTGTKQICLNWIRASFSLSLGSFASYLHTIKVSLGN